MPTINIKKRDIENLIGSPMSLDDLKQYLYLVKGEFKDYDDQKDELRVEISDSNRPDLWCVEGIARQIMGKLKGEWRNYDFFYTTEGMEKTGDIIVSAGMKDIRPYVGGFAACNIHMDEDMLTQLIQTQEKISEIFGSKRRRISIGIYSLSMIDFPVYYKDVKPEAISFIPLGFDESMDLDSILRKHPKGQAYGSILRDYARYPILIDSKGKVLSFPPIINSREVGEVKVRDRDIFVEVTGTDLRLVLLVLNILSVNLFDRGAKIKPSEVRYPYDTEFGSNISTPVDLTGPISLSYPDIEKVLGEKIPMDEVAALLDSYGYWVRKKGEILEVTPPPFRDDIMHPVDICEDIAISRGYSSFTPIMPSQMTIGTITEIESFSDRLREYMVGCGFQEIISNILTSKEDILDRMCLGDEKVIEVDNIMSRSYSVLRHWIIPSLLRVEASSGETFYPHRIFEVGEVALYDESQKLWSRTAIKCAALISHGEANFSEIHSIVENLMYYLQIECKLIPVKHPSFIDGRSGYICVGDEEVGLIGEVHPEVLTNWEIHMPCSVFEMDVDKLLDIYSQR